MRCWLVFACLCMKSYENFGCVRVSLVDMKWRAFNSYFRLRTIDLAVIVQFDSLCVYCVVNCMMLFEVDSSVLVSHSHTHTSMAVMKCSTEFRFQRWMLNNEEAKEKKSHGQC